MVSKLFRWSQSDGMIHSSSMTNMKSPAFPEVPVPLVPEDILVKLLKVCQGGPFENHRDTALLRDFIDCGLRLAEATPRHRPNSQAS